MNPIVLMKIHILPFLLAAAMIAAAPLCADVPQTIHYQGKVSVDGTPFDGTGHFKFALVDGGTENVANAQAEAIVNNGFVTAIIILDGGNGYLAAPSVTITGGGGSGAQATATITDGVVTAITVTTAGSGYTSLPTVSIAAPPPATMQTLWSNDGTSTGGSQPHSEVALAVSQGVFSLGLGDVSLSGMSEPLTAEALLESPRYLRVWFNDGRGFQQLAPDQPLHAVPFAMVADRAQSVPEGAISLSQIDPTFTLWSKDAATGGVSQFVSGQGGIRITPFEDPSVNENRWSPMIALGHADNEAEARGATVSGGGTEDFPNIASGPYSTIGGGTGNTASGFWSTIGGGEANTASGRYSTVGGGEANTASGWYSTIGGGLGNSASGWTSTIGGGEANAASGRTSTIGGGNNNTASGFFSTVPGGQFNLAAGDNSFAAGQGARVMEGHHGTFIWADSTAAFFDSTGTNQFLIRSNGGVGIGTNSPSAQLQVAGSFISGATNNTATGTNSFVGGGSSNAATGLQSFAAGNRAKAVHDGTFVWADGTSADFASTGINQFLIRANGGVGIGTNSPSAQLQVAGSFISGATNNTATGTNSFVGGGGGNIASGSAGFVAGGVNNTASGIRSFAAGNRAKAIHTNTFVWADSTSADFSSTGQNQFLIRANGGVGIGVNAPEDALHIKGRSSAALILENRDGLNGWGIGTGISSGNFNFYYNANVYPFSTAASARLGFINNVTGTYTADSDERLKRDIETLDDVLGRVLSLRPTTYRFKRGTDTDPLSVGFIAQEVQEIFPDLVHQPDEDGYLALAYSDFGVLAIRAIQEQQAIIASQAAKLEAQRAQQQALEARLSRLEALLAAESQ